MAMKARSYLPGSAERTGMYKKEVKGPRATGKVNANELMSLAGAPGKAMAKLGQGVHEAGDAVFARAEEIRQKAIVRAVQEARVNFQRELTKELYGPESSNPARDNSEDVVGDPKVLDKGRRAGDQASGLQGLLGKAQGTVPQAGPPGVFNLRGQDAIGSTQAFAAKHLRKIDELVSTWSGGAAAMLRNELMATFNQHYAAVARHEGNQRSLWKKTLVDREFESARATVALFGGAQDDKATETAIGQAVTRISLNVEGGPAQRQAILAEKKRALWQQALNAKIMADPMRAERILARIKDDKDPIWKAEYFDAQTLTRFLGKVKQVKKERLVEDFIDKNVPLAAVEKTLAGMKDLMPGERRAIFKTVRAEYRHRQAVVNQARAKHVAGLRNQVYEAAAVGTFYTQAQLRKMGFHGKDLLEMAAWLDKARNKDIKTDPAAFDKAEALVNSGDILTPGDIPKNLRDNIGVKGLQRLGKRINDVQDALGAKVRDFDQTFKATALGLGLDKDDWTQFREVLEARVRDVNMDRARQNKPRLTAGEITRLVREEMGEQVVGKGFWGAKKETRWEVSQDVMGVGDKDVPPEAIEFIRKKHPGLSVRQARREYFLGPAAMRLQEKFPPVEVGE